MTRERSCTVPFRKRRWRRLLQFSVGTLLLFMTVICIWLGWVTNSANRQKRAVQWLEQNGARVNFDFQRALGPDGESGYSYLVEQPGPRWLRRLIGDDFFRTADRVHIHHDARLDDTMAAQIGELVRVESLYLTDGQLTETGARHFAGLRGLKSLVLRKNKIGDVGVAHLAKLSNLEELELTENQVTDAGLVHLKNLAQLRTLFLYDNPIGDEGMTHLASLQNLEMLGLGGTQITDEGLLRLMTLKKLKYISLSGTRITSQGAKQMKAVLPNCDVAYLGP